MGNKVGNAITTVLELEAYLKSGNAKEALLGDGLHVRRASRRFVVRYRVRGDMKVREYTIPAAYGKCDNQTSWAKAKARASAIVLNAKVGTDLIAEEERALADA